MFWAFSKWIDEDILKKLEEEYRADQTDENFEKILKKLVKELPTETVKKFRKDKIGELKGDMYELGTEFMKARKESKRTKPYDVKKYTLVAQWKKKYFPVVKDAVEERLKTQGKIYKDKQGRFRYIVFGKSKETKRNQFLTWHFAKKVRKTKEGWEEIE